MSEYIIEFIQVGNALKVSAIDPKTGKEVSIVGSPSQSKKELADVAAQKLNFVIKKCMQT